MKKTALVLLILLIAVALRLWGLGGIDKIYFDEIHYLYDALKYQQGVLALERESAAAPKHGMFHILFMQAGVSFFGFNYLGWRIFSVIFGVISILAVILLAGELFSFRAALLCGFLLSLNFLHLVLSRIAMADIYLLALMLLGFYFLARSLKRQNSEGLLLAGAFLGLSLTVKSVALLSLPVGFLIYSLAGVDPKKRIRGVTHLVLFPLFIFALVSMYLNLSAGVDPLSWARYELRNLEYHRIYAFVHPHSARAWGWPLVLKSTPFYGMEAGKGMLRAVIAFGNPLVYWPMIPVFAYLICEYLRKKDPSLLFVLIGFFGLYLPWLVYEGIAALPQFARRGVFFFYFMPAIPFYLMGLSYLLDRMLDHKWGRALAIIYLALVIGSFLFFAPLLYGLPLSQDHFNKLIWLKGWWI